MNSDHTAVLQNATKRRAELVAQVERLKGRLQEAEANKQAVEAECRAKKIEPEQIDEAIAKLEQRFDKEMNTLQKAMDTAESALQPYENGVN